MNIPKRPEGLSCYRAAKDALGHKNSGALCQMERHIKPMSEATAAKLTAYYRAIESERAALRVGRAVLDGRTREEIPA